jgi:cytochrome c
VVRAALVATSRLVVTPVRVWRRTLGPARRTSWCRACHQIGPNAKNAVAPALNGVAGRPGGTHPGDTDSEVNKGSGLVWTPEEPDKYLTSPQTVMPRTKMIVPGLKDQQKRNDVIADLSQFAVDG